MSFKKTMKSVWHFIWEDDSLLSWIVNVVLAYIIIKFLLYPGLGIVLGTTHPVVAVVSGSMEHDGSFEEWWNSYAVCSESCTQEQWYARLNITQSKFKKFSFSNGFNVGDIMVVTKGNPEKINPGDILVFRANKADPIIHRVVAKEHIDGKYYFKTKGDHNTDFYYAIGEDNIYQDRIVGKAVLRIPYLGYIKIAFVKLIELVSF